MTRAALLVLLVACHGPSHAPQPTPAPTRITLSVVGTSDWHGKARGFPLFAGYLENLRAVQPVVLVDAGDMFQGTLESNLGEGAVVVEAMNALGYTAAAIGNHEFDFGPVGPPVSGGDPRGALAARAGEARFPFLAANVVDLDGKFLPFARPTALVEIGGVKVGLIGVTTEATLNTTLPANVSDLRILPLAETFARHAAELRGQGAQLVIGLAHAGGKCQRFDDPHDLSSCAPDEEIMAVAAALPPGTLDVIVGGHSHQAMAHMVNGVAIIQSYAVGKAFGRVDVTLERGRVVERTIFAPQELVAGDYAGRPVVADARVAALADDDREKARATEARPLGIELTDTFTPAYDQESEIGNLFADMMLAWAEAHRPAGPGRYVALTNGGGLRASLEGALTYGALYEAYPFDNRFAVLPISGAELREVVAGNLQRSGGILSVAGVRVRASCQPDLVVELTTPDGQPVDDKAAFLLVTSDFLATGGDGTLGKLSPRDIQIPAEPLVRDAIGETLGKKGGRLAGTDLFDPRHPRLQLSGARPLCVR